jgi:hypothetical protein
MGKMSFGFGVLEKSNMSIMSFAPPSAGVMAGRPQLSSMNLRIDTWLYRVLETEPPSVSDPAFVKGEIAINGTRNPYEMASSCGGGM